MATAPKAVPKVVPKVADTPAEAPVKSKKKIYLIAAITLLLIAGAAGGWFYLQDKNAAAGSAQVEAPKAPVFITLEPFTVNLQTEDIDQYLQTQFSLQVADSGEADNIKLYMPQVRSRLLTLLSSRKASELNTPEGKQQLTDDIIAQVKKPFTAKGPEQKVSNVFFTSFVIQ